MYRVMITTDIADADYVRVAAGVLQDFAVVEHRICRSEEDLIQACADADATISVFEPFTKRVFAALPKLKLVAVSGIGYNFVDVKSAAQYGVGVCNNPFYCVEEVADHTAALMLALTRKVVEYYHAVKIDRVWNAAAQKDKIRRLSGQTVGLIGFGNIARRVARRMQGFGCEVISYDPFISQETADPYGVRMVTLEQLYSKADMVSLHLHVTKDTIHMIDARAFALMAAKQPLLINCSRGELVDENALMEALESGKIRGAGLDTLSSENPDPNHLPLAGTKENVILTPHAAYLSADALREQKRTTSRYVRDFLSGDTDRVPIVNGIRTCKQA